MTQLDYYLTQLSNVRPFKRAGSKSPHKACLLFAVIDLIQDGLLVTNKIILDESLKSRFAWHFNRLKTDKDKLDIAKPFFYLRSSSFWHHKLKGGQETIYEKIKTPSERLIYGTIEYAYIDDQLFRFIQDYAKARKLRHALFENVDSNEESFKHWAISIGKSESTASKYTNALKGTISKLLISEGDSHRNIFDITDYFDVARLINKASEIREFQEYNYRGNGMYSAALKLYRSYLDQVSDSQLEVDVAEVNTNSELTETTKLRLIQARLGQGLFRQRLLTQWNARCAVTGYSNISLLMASHIKPWSISTSAERLDPHNGLLLTPNLDKAFDLHFISFTNKGNILISDELGDYHSLGFDKDMKIAINDFHSAYLAEHRERYFEKLI
ncbi:hypothetical protein PSI9734_01748 [Pseudidiomarina piscicola]|uniref:HNH nuclease domain-containing protein n=1 Tax=Pseudidiomarina piscicola TaxID=2614830 RepID=A0A6S6WP86_9GAMM|nr:HNH endonuclease [Pseudidiomarina piscicola]CAB0151359.1 hypothetical protein PSI9734_01748 [Pseudidiomarina piscicola]VZT40840.1 hypothetical protein PSI9734_01748 [Pseudomonas aeruginosa]